MAAQNSTCSSTPNCMPPSTLLSILQNARAVAPNNLVTMRPRRQQQLKQPQTESQNSTCTSTPNCTPYHPKVSLAKLRQQRHLHACPLAPGHLSRKNSPAPSPATQTITQTARQSCTRSPCHQSCKKCGRTVTCTTNSSPNNTP